MEIKYALFDMDGTVINSLFYWNEKWRELGERFLNIKDYTVPTYVDKNIRTMKLRECALYVKKALNLNVSDDEIFDFFNNDLLEFYKQKTNVKDGIKELLNEFNNNGVKICLATATSSDTAKKVLEHFNLSRYFYGVVSCSDEDVNAGKDSPRVYLKALKILNADVKSTILFEDSFIALKTAKGIGLKTVGIEDKYNENTDKLKYYADIFIKENENIYDSFKRKTANTK